MVFIRSKQLFLMWLMSISVLLISACGGGGDTPDNAPPAAPKINAQPLSIAVFLNQTASFSVNATGGSQLSYQWKKNGVIIPGAVSNVYTTSAASFSDSGSQFSVVVFDKLGRAVTSNIAVLTVLNETPSDLLISEVSSCFFVNINCWFELYNPTSLDINLSNYSLKSRSTDISTGAGSVRTFTFPSIVVPSKGYVVISGNSQSAQQLSAQLVYLKSGNSVPYWDASGFIEILKNSQTVDFVRFGNSSQLPTLAGHWLSDSVASLPSSEGGYNKAIVRNIAALDTNDKTNWFLVDFATPSGVNDVPVGAVDADDDGIPDSAEVPGGTFAGLDLYAMGARAGQRDLFIEVDRMDSADPGVIPRIESLQKVVDVFAAQSIHVHFDAGNLFSSSFSTSNFNLGQTDSLVPYQPCITIGIDTSDRAQCSNNSSDYRVLHDWKERFFDLRKTSIFHYLLFSYSQRLGGEHGSSGIAEIVGNDFIVSMGNWGLSTAPGSDLNKLINMQASTIMHELGHNLGLHHGGDEETNYKPNYFSIMNYIYQLNGLIADPSSATAYLRWARATDSLNLDICTLDNSPCDDPSQFVMDYSHGLGIDLNENVLLESNNIGYGANVGAYADWNLSSNETFGSYSKDLNKDTTRALLRDHNDWSNLVLPFARYASSQNSGTRQNTPSSYKQRSAKLIPAIANDVQPVIKETPPSKAFFEQLRK